MTSQLMSVKCQIDFNRHCLGYGDSADSEGQLVPPDVAVNAFQLLDAGDVGARLGVADAGPASEPAVDVVLARVVGGERRTLVVVLVEQVPQVPSAVANVDLGVVEVFRAEARAA